MKKIFQILILLLITSNAFACSCNPLGLMTRFQYSKFIAKVKIISSTEDISNPRYLNVEVEILELFKGSKTTSIKVENPAMGGCGLTMELNSTWLIFAAKDIEEFETVSSCSGCLLFDRVVKDYPEVEMKHKKLLERQLEVLRYLKDNNFQNNNPENLQFRYNSNCYREFKGYEVHQQFAIYEIEVSKDFSVKNIHEVITFENKELSEKIMSCLHNLTIFHPDSKAIDHPIKLLLAFYYNPAEKNRESFISTTDRILQ